MVLLFWAVNDCSTRYRNSCERARPGQLTPGAFLTVDITAQQVNWRGSGVQIPLLGMNTLSVS